MKRKLLVIFFIFSFLSSKSQINYGPKITEMANAGVSCATCAITQVEGMSKSPDSSCISPRNKANKDDLPAPFAPVKPTL